MRLRQLLRRGSTNDERNEQLADAVAVEVELEREARSLTVGQWLERASPVSTHWPVEHAKG